VSFCICTVVINGEIGVFIMEEFCEFSTADQA
jgi:hypothetical protein